MESQALYRALAEAVVGMKPQRVAELARRAIELGLKPDQAITEGLARGMKQVGEKFAAREYFVPEVLLASRAMYAGFDILQAELGSDREPRGPRAGYSCSAAESGSDDREREGGRSRGAGRGSCSARGCACGVGA